MVPPPPAKSAAPGLGPLPVAFFSAGGGRPMASPRYLYGPSAMRMTKHRPQQPNSFPARPCTPDLSRKHPQSSPDAKFPKLRPTSKPRKQAGPVPQTLAPPPQKRIRPNFRPQVPPWAQPRDPNPPPSQPPPRAETTSASARD